MLKKLLDTFRFHCANSEGNSTSTPSEASMPSSPESSPHRMHQTIQRTPSPELEDHDTRIVIDGYRIPNVEADLWEDRPRKHLHMRLDRIYRLNRLIERCKREVLPAPDYPNNECVICLDKEATCMNIPCAHHVTCRGCAAYMIKMCLEDEHLWKESIMLSCVVCRHPVTRVRYFNPAKEESKVRKLDCIRMGGPFPFSYPERPWLSGSDCRIPSRETSITECR